MIITKILDGINNLNSAIQLSSESLMAGEPIAFPTETVYGVGALIFNENSIKKVFDIKNRNIGNPLSAHISSLSDIEYLCKDIPDDFWKIADKFLPGPISVVLNRSDVISDLVTGNIQSLNIRMPDHKVFQELSKAVAKPIAGTSANLSGRPSPNNAHSVLDDLGGRLEYILDGGKCRYSIESTVISMIEEPVLIRPGVIEQREIEKVLGRKILSLDKNLVRLASSNQSSVSNLKYKLYWSESSEEVSEYLKQNKNLTLLMLSKENFNKIEHQYKIILNIESIFESMRYAEKNNFDEVIILFDNFVNNIELIKHRIKFAEKLKTIWMNSKEKLK